MTRTALITGGAGFIGSHLADMLLDEGWEVDAADNFDESYSPAIKRSNVLHNLGRELYRLHELDVRDGAAMERDLRAHYDVVVHLAGKAGPRQSLLEPQLFEDVNVGGTRTVLDFCVARGIRRLVFASSSSVYGLNELLPWSEEAQPRPISPYAVTKLSAEMLGHTYSNLHGIGFTALRFFTVFGPRQRPGLAMHIFAEQMLNGGTVSIFGDGTARRDFTYIGDLVSGIRAAMDRDTPSFEIFNLGSNRPVTVMQMVRALETSLGLEARVRWEPADSADLPASWADTGKAERLLGYNARTPFEDGVREFASWIRARESLRAASIPDGVAG